MHESSVAHQVAPDSSQALLLLLYDSNVLIVLNHDFKVVLAVAVCSRD